MRTEVREWRRGDYLVSTDPARLDLDLVHGFLEQSYWAEGIPREVVARSIEGALCFGIYGDRGQVGFGRVVTDLATFAYIGDVFVLVSHRGLGLSKWLMECMLGHPDLQDLRRWHLVTRDAQGLYGRSGFRPVSEPGWHMERVDPGVYKRRRFEEPH